jgi:hypothetical protein
MVNLRWLKIEYLHRVGDLKFKRLKVAALKLIHPTASPPFQGTMVFVLRHSLLGGG